MHFTAQDRQFARHLRASVRAELVSVDEMPGWRAGRLHNLDRLLTWILERTDPSGAPETSVQGREIL